MHAWLAAKGVGIAHAEPISGIAFIRTAGAVDVVATRASGNISRRGSSIAVATVGSRQASDNCAGAIRGIESVTEIQGTNTLVLM